MNTKKATTFIAGLVTGMLAIYLWGQTFGAKTDVVTDVQEIAEVVDTQDIENNLIEGTAQDAGAIQVADQAAGDVVQVASVSMPKLGWVVVHEVKDGVIANALGASLRDAGEHSDIVVYLLRGTKAGNEYAVVLYEDDGNREFSIASDAPLKSAAGNFVMAKFNTN